MGSHRVCTFLGVVRRIFLYSVKWCSKFNQMWCVIKIYFCLRKDDESIRFLATIFADFLLFLYPQNKRIFFHPNLIPLSLQRSNLGRDFYLIIWISLINSKTIIWYLKNYFILFRKVSSYVRYPIVVNLVMSYLGHVNLM